MLIRISLIFIILLFVISIVLFFGCEKMEAPTSGETSTNLQASIKNPLFTTSSSTPDPFNTNLIAGGGNSASAIAVGIVSVSNDNDYLSVKYTTNTDWHLTKTHLHVATSLECIPMTITGNPIPGQFDCAGEHECTNEFVFDLPLDWTPETVLYIAAHASVINEVDSVETAWGNGSEFPGKNWATYFTYIVKSPEPLSEIRVTTNDNHQGIPDIYADFIVWQEVVGSFNNCVFICEWDGSECEPVKIAPPLGITAHTTSPAIDGNRIVWTDYGGKLYICEWNGSSCSEHIRIPKNKYSQVSPAIFGNLIAWRESYFSGTLGTLYNLVACEWNGGSCCPHKFPSFRVGPPAVDGNLIVWSDELYDPGPARAIRLCVWNSWDPGNSQIINVYSGSGNRSNPDVSGNLIVWQDNRSGNFDIYLSEWDGTTCSEPVQITTHPTHQRKPVIHGNLIVWEDSRNGGDLLPGNTTGNWDIYWCEWNGLGCSAPTPITTDENTQLNPAIHGNRVVWQDNRNGNYDIYMSEIY